jgi:hypothetical protein
VGATLTEKTLPVRSSEDEISLDPTPFDPDLWADLRIGEVDIATDAHAVKA